MESKLLTFLADADLLEQTVSCYGIFLNRQNIYFSLKLITKFRLIR